MQDLKDKVLEIVRYSGPVIPVNISKAINTNILFASAILSELVSQKKLYVTNAKIGGSPMYYLKGQESKIQTLYNHLGERPREIFNLIKEKKVLRDKELEPWQRVAIREIKDFAVMLNVTIQDETEVFWKWYLISDDEAKGGISEVLKKGQREIIPDKIPDQEVKGEQTRKVKKVGEKRLVVKRDKNHLRNKIYRYLEDNNIKVLAEQAGKNRSDLEFLAEMMLGVGELNLFVKLVDKRKINEGDLGIAYSKARGRPVLLLITGEITKKAKEYLEKNLKGSLIVKNLG